MAVLVQSMTYILAADIVTLDFGVYTIPNSPHAETRDAHPISAASR